MRARAAGPVALVAAVLVLALCASPVVATTSMRAVVHSPVGSWKDTYTVVTAGPLKGQKFANPTVIKTFNAKTGAFSGTDSSLKFVGSLHGNKWSATASGGGYVCHIHGTITFKAHGAATWKGTWHDSNGNSGTWHGSRPAKHKAA